MKFLGMIVIIVIVAVAFMQFKSEIFTPEPVKVYIEYRKKHMASKGFSSQKSSMARWEMEVTDCQIEDSEATITAIERTSEIPANAASNIFATKTTRELRAILITENKTWTLTDERVLKQDVSTYDDRNK